MFYLNFIPEWVFHLLLLIGFGGIIVSAVMRNALILPIAFFILTSALFVEGVVFGQADMRRQVAEMEAKIQTLTAESKQVNVQLVEKYKTKIVKIKENSDEIISMSISMLPSMIMIVACLMLSSCSTIVPPKPLFPIVPQEYMKEPPTLKSLRSEKPLQKTTEPSTKQESK